MYISEPPSEGNQEGYRRPEPAPSHASPRSLIILVVVLAVATMFILGGMALEIF
jgi:hypothetical protein